MLSEFIRAFLSKSPRPFLRAPPPPRDTAPAPRPRFIPSGVEGRGNRIDPRLINEHVAQLVGFLRDRPCGIDGLGSYDRCGAPHAASLCGVHSAAEQVRSDVAMLLAQVERTQPARVAVAAPRVPWEPTGPTVKIQVTPTPDEDDELMTGELQLSEEVVVSETIRLTQKIQFRS